MRLRDPGTELVLACRPGLGEFFLRNKLVDRVVEIDKKSGEGRARALEALRAEEWDLIVCPHESFRTAWWMRGLRAREGKIGFAKWWNRFAFSRRVVKPVDYPDALRQLSLMTSVDSGLAELFAAEDMSHMKNPYSRRSPLALDVPAIPEWAAMKVLDNKSDGRTVFLAPGSVWATKRWTETGYVGLAQILKARNFNVVLVGSPDERELCEAVAKAVPGVENRAGQTSLSGLVEMLAGGVALVCNDSGAMHAASAAGLPTVALFGPTVLSQGFRPWNSRAIVLQRDIGCRPCGKHGARKCPIGTHECMTQIFAEDVYSALADFMNARKN
jgi:heptosyltransferase-2